MCLLAGAFLLTLQQDPLITRPKVYRVVRELLPREALLWGISAGDSRASRSHEKRRASGARPPYLPKPSL